MKLSNISLKEYITIQDNQFARYNETDFYNSDFNIFFNRDPSRHRKEYREAANIICNNIPATFQSDDLHRKAFAFFRTGVCYNAYNVNTIDQYLSELDSSKDNDKYGKKIANVHKTLLSSHEDENYIIAPLQGEYYTPGWESLAIFWALLWVNAPFTKTWYKQDKEEFSTLIRILNMVATYDKCCYPGISSMVIRQLKRKELYAANATHYISCLANYTNTLGNSRKKCLIDDRTRVEKEYIWALFIKGNELFKSIKTGEAWLMISLYIRNELNYWGYMQMVYNSIESDMRSSFDKIDLVKIQEIKEILSTIHIAKPDEYYESVFTDRTISVECKEKVLAFILRDGKGNFKNRKERLSRLISFCKKQAFFYDFSQLDCIGQKLVVEELFKQNKGAGSDTQDNNSINNLAFEQTMYYAIINIILELDIPRVNSLNFLDNQLSPDNKQRLAHSKRKKGSSSIINLEEILKQSENKTVYSGWEDYSIYLALFNMLKYPIDLWLHYGWSYDDSFTYLRNIIENHIWYYSRIQSQLK